MKFNKLNTYTRMKRPTIKSFREVLHKTGGNITKAAAAFGVNRGTLYNWMKDNEAFMEALKDERGALVDEVSCLGKDIGVRHTRKGRQRQLHGMA